MILFNGGYYVYCTLRLLVALHKILSGSGASLDRTNENSLNAETSGLSIVVAICERLDNEQVRYLFTLAIH